MQTPQAVAERGPKIKKK